MKHLILSRDASEHHAILSHQHGQTPKRVFVRNYLLNKDDQ